LRSEPGASPIDFAEELGTGTSAPATLLVKIYEILDEILDPCSVANSTPMGLVEMGIVKNVDVTDDGQVRVDLRLTSPFCEMIPYMQGEAIRNIVALDGVAGCEVTRDSGMEWDHGLIAVDAQKRRRLRLLSAREQQSWPHD